MKVGDLVRCLFQPRISRVRDGECVPMEHTIKGELGIIMSISMFGTPRVLFPKFRYEHPVAPMHLKVINESR